MAKDRKLLTYLSFLKVCMVIVEGNGHSDPSSNTGQGW